jgi:hypothetical protein
MKKQIIISAIGLILVLCMVANADEEYARRMHEVEQMRLEVEKLHLEAMEHELKARQLRMEAARINLRVRAETLHARRQREQRRDIEMTQRRISELRVASERAEKDGQVDKAKHLWNESKHLAEELERRTEGRQREEYMSQMHMRRKKLTKALERAEHEGNERLMGMLQKEAENLEREIHEHERDTKAEHLEREIHQLLAAAKKAEEKGMGDHADAMRREAEQLQQHLCELCEECPNDECDKKCEQNEDNERDNSDELWEKIESLHRQLAELNEVVELLRNKLK